MTALEHGNSQLLYNMKLEWKKCGRNTDIQLLQKNPVNNLAMKGLCENYE